MRESLRWEFGSIWVNWGRGGEGRGSQPLRAAKSGRRKKEKKRR